MLSIRLGNKTIEIASLRIFGPSDGQGNNRWKDLPHIRHGFGNCWVMLTLVEIVLWFSTTWKNLRAIRINIPEMPRNRDNLDQLDPSERQVKERRRFQRRANLARNCESIPFQGIIRKREGRNERSCSTQFQRIFRSFAGGKPRDQNRSIVSPKPPGLHNIQRFFYLHKKLPPVSNGTKLIRKAIVQQLFVQIGLWLLHDWKRLRSPLADPWLHAAETIEIHFQR